jgi:hypothetical protein
MDITHEQLDRYLCKIFTGIDVLYIKDGSEDICIEFRQPDNTIKLRANLVYDKACDKAIDEGMLATEDLKKLIKKRNIFTEADEEKIKKLESKLAGQEILLAKTMVVKAHQDRLKKIIRELKEEINELQFKKTSKLMMSAEAKAEEERSLFFCWACTYNTDKNELYWINYNDLLKETNIVIKDKILIEFLKFYRGLDTRLIRFIARNNLWRIRHVTSQKTSDPLFGLPTSQYTNDMLNLAYWSNYYQNIYEMLAEDRPSDLVIEDDEALDAYMTFYYNERTKDDAARRSKNRTQGKLSAFDKEEVIVTQSNELYEDIKYDKPREAQRIKNRSDIRKKARRG